MIFVFDLDDTLYEEITYVKSGFLAVSQFLSLEFGLPETNILMEEVLKKEGRGKIFNTILEKYDILNEQNIKDCIEIYREHDPKIELLPTALNCLSKYECSDKYIITDGLSSVQSKKVKALKIKDLFKEIYYTWDFNQSKPSPYCFDQIMKQNKGREACYIGDNPYKDFIGAKRAGMLTIRVLQGQYRNIPVLTQHLADIIINNLEEL